MNTDHMKSMPYSEDAEMAVVGAMMFDSRSAIPFAIEQLNREMFYHPATGTLFEALMHLHEQGKSVEYPAVVAYLTDVGLISQAGGPAYISACATTFISTASLGQYAAILKDRHQRREAIKMCQGQLEGALNLEEGEMPQWAAEMVEKSMRLHEASICDGCSKGRNFRDVLYSVIDESEAQKGRGLPTGFSLLDQKIGGAREGKLVVIAGGTSDGKTALALQIATHFANEGHPGSVFSLEMPGEELVQRMACNDQLIESSLWLGRGMTRDESRRFADFCRERKPIKIYDEIERIDEICAAIRLDKGRIGLRWAIIDYIQLCEATRGKTDNREREVAMISKALKRLAVNLNITVIALSQLNDDGKLRESRAIGQDADCVLVISTTKKEGERVVRLAKNRGGQRNCKILMDFEGKYFRFTEKQEVP